MKFLISLALLALVEARFVEQICDDVIVHNTHHEKEILLDRVDSPYQLAIDYDTNMLFFSFSTSQPGQTFSSAYINLKTNKYNIIPGINGGFANGVDNVKHIVYLGGTDGLYEFDFQAKKANHIGGTYHSIWQIFSKKDVYYTTYPNEELYVYKNKRLERVPELADTRVLLVALNKDFDYYFSNSSGLFKLTKSNMETRSLGDFNLNALTADNNGNIYFSTPNGIYYINDKDNVQEIASIPNIYGVAIESDGNIIYSTKYSLIRLKPTKTPCFVDEKNNNNQNNNL